MAVVARFHCDVMTYGLARLDLRPGAAKASGIACGYGNVVGLTSILDQGQLSAGVSGV